LLTGGLDRLRDAGAVTEKFIVVLTPERS